MVFLLATFLLAFQEDSVWHEAGRLSQAARDDLDRAELERKNGHPEEALAVFRKYLGDPQFEPGQFAPKTSQRIAAFWVRGEAQRSLANALEEEGKSEEALQAYRDCLRRPLPSDCGNGYASQALAAQMGEGRCLERLGRHHEAVAVYFLALEHHGLTSVEEAAVRTVALYEAVGRLGDLKKTLDRRDLWFVDQESFEGRRIRDLDELTRLLPSRRFQRALAAADAEREGRWAELVGSISELISPRAVDVDIMRRLARHPMISVPLLAAQLREGSPRRWIAYTLGLCGGTDALEALRAAAQRDSHREDLEFIVRALELLGAPGREALQGLRNEEALKIEVPQFEGRGPFFLLDDERYPVIPKDAKLD